MSDTITIIGVDPGVKGAIAYVIRDGPRIVEANAFRMPMTKRGKANAVDVDAIISRMSFFDCGVYANLAVIESPIKKGKMTSHDTLRISFTNFGRLQVAIERVSKEWQSVHPAVWKSKLGISSDKAKSVQLAGEIYPDLKERGLFTKANSHDIAEALLIAEYAYRHVWLEGSYG